MSMRPSSSDGRFLTNPFNWIPHPFSLNPFNFMIQQGNQAWPAGVPFAISLPPLGMLSSPSLAPLIPSASISARQQTLVQQSEVPCSEVSNEYSTALKHAFCNWKIGFLNGEIIPELENPLFPVSKRSRSWLSFLRKHWSDYSWTEGKRIPSNRTLLTWFKNSKETEEKKNSLRPAKEKLLSLEGKKCFKRKGRQNPSSSESSHGTSYDSTRRQTILGNPLESRKSTDPPPTRKLLCDGAVMELESSPRRSSPRVTTAHIQSMVPDTAEVSCFARGVVLRLYVLTFSIAVADS
jgi:hypothetical protein